MNKQIVARIVELAQAAEFNLKAAAARLERGNEHMSNVLIWQAHDYSREAFSLAQEG